MRATLSKELLIGPCVKSEKNPTLNKIAIEVAKEIRQMDSKARHWIADDALRE
jgi:hypothetical protein